MASDFDRAGTVAAVRDYHHFLAKMYLDEDRIMEPPPGGWSNITPETMRPLGKTDEVVDLLRHLPYIRSDDVDTVQIVPYGKIAVWPEYANRFTAGADASGVLFCTDGDDGDGEVWVGGVPLYCVGLTIAARDDVILLLDTFRGCIWWMECPHEIAWARDLTTPTIQEERDEANVPVIVEGDGLGIELDDEQTSDEEDNESRTSGEESPPTSDDGAQGGSDDEVDDDEEERVEDEEEEEDLGPEWIQDFWFPQWGISEFFEKMKKHYRQLDFVPRNSKEVLEGWPRDSKEPRLVDWLKSIYRKYGWPNLEQYRKEECMKEIEQALRKADPDRYGYESDSWSYRSLSNGLLDMSKVAESIL